MNRVLLLCLFVVFAGCATSRNLSAESMDHFVLGISDLDRGRDQLQKSRGGRIQGVNPPRRFASDAGRVDAALANVWDHVSGHPDGAFLYSMEQRITAPRQYFPGWLLSRPSKLRLRTGKRSLDYCVCSAQKSKSHRQSERS